MIEPFIKAFLTLWLKFFTTLVLSLSWSKSLLLPSMLYLQFLRYFWNSLTFQPFYLVIFIITWCIEIIVLFQFSGHVEFFFSVLCTLFGNVLKSYFYHAVPWKISNFLFNISVEQTEQSMNSASAGAIATILVFLVVIIAVSVWVYYAYRNPQSSSGQFLIKVS